MNHQLASSLCSSNNTVNTVIYGASLDFDPADCLVNNLYTCTWYESMSMHCRRWSQMHNQTIKLAFQSGFLETFKRLYPEQQVFDAEISLGYAIQRFTVHYDNHYFAAFDEKYRESVFLSSVLSIFVLAFLAISVYQTVKGFYQEAETEEEEAFDVFQEDDQEERRFAQMTRRQIIEVFAGVRQLEQ